ncbi:hypothetical protein VNO78_30951 [Psophocarpus tetragonolobus]|uniref:Mei2-like C-terminal RNA recognition motif domain-containing protein n=1 Tax=Psophocarpus tetragonolobus TaxID=3891 RepID=A0AAN9RXV0_PSOTE
MLSQQTLNPNAQPYYPRSVAVPHITTSCFHAPFPTHAPTYEYENVKVWTRRNMRCHRKFYKLPEKARALRYRLHIPFPKTVEEAKTSSITTLMIRNIPNQFKSDDLLLILDEYCLQHNMSVLELENQCKFDFVYVPMDYRKHAIQKRTSNLGYAFVNFTTPAAAFKFCRDFEGRKWNVARSKKICEINVAQYQGKDTLMKIFQQKIFRCESRDFLPMVFGEGRDGLNRRIKATYVGTHVVYVSCVFILSLEMVGSSMQHLGERAPPFLEFTNRKLSSGAQITDEGLQ